NCAATCARSDPEKHTCAASPRKGGRGTRRSGADSGVVRLPLVPFVVGVSGVLAVLPFFFGKGLQALGQDGEFVQGRGAGQDHGHTLTLIDQGTPVVPVVVVLPPTVAHVDRADVLGAPDPALHDPVVVALTEHRVTVLGRGKTHTPLDRPAQVQGRTGRGPPLGQ